MTLFTAVSLRNLCVSEFHKTIFTFGNHLSNTNIKRYKGRNNTKWGGRYFNVVLFKWDDG